MPEGDDDGDAWEDVGLEDAREASSRESRGRRFWLRGEVREA